ncbi:MAG: hypothetical protein AUG90_00700 [Verrucomicrobia bacterium 13_1_20CM_4_55_9]|nr:MAG: hypothetical protein AUG90_00700 [Verrucomicrobia bacterium 13_1_20CM_4_55_9]PYJ83311.1 MAG: hypothetical protein DME73_02755 [Verrucomicrobiota bacterium]PYL96983.1 MAG: hypothetical protein DMF18_03945 [Verrucomicrobiota bacterium]
MTRQTRKCFVAQKKIAPADKPPERLSKVGISLANLGAQEFAVALDAHFSAAQQVSHGRDRFFCVLRAGTDCQDEIAKGKFRTLL